MFRRSAAIAAMAITGLLAVPGAAGASGSSPGIADSCANPSVIQEGFLDNRAVFFSVRAQQNPSYATSTFVCYHVKVGSVDSAGRIDVTGSAVTGRLPTTDALSSECTGAPGNNVPGPHPLEQGAIGPVGFFVDIFAIPDEAWVCLEAGNVKERVVVPLPGLTTPVVDVTQDSSPSPPQATATPTPGLPSSSCYAGAHGAATELVNTEHGAAHLFVYSAGTGVAGQAHLCARVNGGPHPAGVDLGVNTTPGDIARLTTSTDVTPCTTNVVTTSTPPLSIKLTPSGLPPSICVTAPGLPPTRYTITTLSGPPPASVTLDP